MHLLRGEKQTLEHILKRKVSICNHFKLHPRPFKNIRQRLLSKIVINEKGCWVWGGCKIKKSNGEYGIIGMGPMKNQKNRFAHVISYNTFVGEIPTGKELHHRCKNTLCINPEHLEPLTDLEHSKFRKDSGLPFCKYGHKYTPETTYINSTGYRECRICSNIHKRRYKEKIKQLTIT